MCIAGMTMLKSGAELGRPLIELVTCPLTAPKALDTSKIRSLSKAGQASCKSQRIGQQAQLRARRGCINFRRIAVKSNASRSLTRRRDRQQEYRQ